MREFLCNGLKQANFKFAYHAIKLILNLAYHASAFTGFYFNYVLIR